MLQQILGTATYQAFITEYFFALIGVAISLLLHSANRDVKDQSTPQHFSISFLIVDNWKRILLNLLVLFVSIRFFPDLTGYNLSLFWCLVAGLGFDKLVQLWKSKASLLQVNR